MASALFRAYEQNMRRQFWMNILDAQTDAHRRQNFRASLIVNPHTGRPNEIVAAHDLDHKQRGT